MTQVRTRFAPSPTGRLHVGNVRTAVFNWLFARHHGGAFVVRLEDTDVERNQEGSEEGILEDLRWLGLLWDEGPDIGGPFGPYRQSERGAFYAEAAARLLESGRAYPCFCSAEVLEAQVTEVAPGVRVHRYPGTCRDLSGEEQGRRIASGEPHLLRLRVPAGGIEVRDEIRGAISFKKNEIDDFILVRRDGRPTYNWAVVVDDIAMEITHVIRGAGHLSNTPKQVLLYDALGASPPAFIHLPTVLGPDRKKLSKRTGSRGVEELAGEGYHPDAVLNYLSLLGWSHPDGTEVLGREALVEAVTLERLGAADTIYDPEKLRWMSQQHIAAMDASEFAAVAAPWVDRGAFPADREAIALALSAIQDRTQLLSEVNDHLGQVFGTDPALIVAARAELGQDAEARRVLEGLKSTLAGLDEWAAAALNTAVRAWGKENQVRGAALFHPPRRALNGLESGPDLGRVMEAMGREATLGAFDATLTGS